MKKVAFFTIASDDHKHYYNDLKNSLAKFHPDIPLEVVQGDTLKNTLGIDNNFYYRATPAIARDLLAEYETVIKIDADSIITGNLDHIINDTDSYDVGTVLNDLPLRVWDIQTYYNCGFVVMKNKEFVEHWFGLCHSPHFNSYQYREQDLLSILTSDYFNYKTKCYDFSDKLHGLIAKPFWSKFDLVDNKIVLNDPQGKKELCVIHFAGGNNDPSKGNYKIRFKPEVVKYIDSLIK